MHIVECDDSHREAWNQFVYGHPDASFYHRFEWRDVNRRCFGHSSAYLAGIAGGRVVGVFPIVQLKSRLFGNIACSMPFVNYGGPCAERADVLIALIDATREVLERWGSKYLEIRNRTDLGEGFPTSEHKISMTVDLDPDSERLFSAFKTGQRQEIRKGVKNGFAAKFGGAEHLDDFYALLSESWRDRGTPIYSRTYFEAIVETFAGAVRICVVYHEGQPVAAAFMGTHGDTVEGMWLAQQPAFRSRNVGYVLYWELIKDACDHGFRHFHLGRSTAHSGSETFKKKWNARTRQLYWQYILRTSPKIPGLNVDNPKYKLAIEAWRRLPVGLTQVVGPPIARSIP